jgi:hypothetical protein
MTNALSHEADIAKIQEWLGHANALLFLCHWNRRPRYRNKMAADEFTEPV